ncbi:hypothetical protein CSUI_001519 [Cystoisospora suis]|uniref:Uncharacterized protein n=1 Tax=Cystoisospora suis TaxID=483139 RepID=A0A2C6LA72_9APIC|nr:hypothetical protein CSUI_001519 [Cystoisospora suis]
MNSFFNTFVISHRLSGSSIRSFSLLVTPVGMLRVTSSLFNCFVISHRLFRILGPQLLVSHTPVGERVGGPFLSFAGVYFVE